MGILGYYGSMIILIPAILLTFYAQMRVKTAYSKYSQVRNSVGVTGAQVAESILARNGMANMPINMIQGNLTDNYNPMNKTLNLSAGVYNSPSIAAIGIAAHECGHAIQDYTGYKLLKFRNTIVPVVNLGSTLAWPMIIIGLILGATGLQEFGVILFGLVVVFHLVTLPVEIDASKRGIALLQDYGFIANDTDNQGAKAVLGAAAMTYVAALATAMANLLRMLILTRNSRR
ncbi:MAG: zinc metallopeptidase [Bacillota bacterium]|nr:zinc metallopeptidase [Bacillota bacterium]